MTGFPTRSFLLLARGIVALAALTVAPAAAAAAAPPVAASNPSPHAINIPPWFRETFLDFREDIREAAKEGKRLMVYFGQDGCPYCKALMQTNFSQKRIVDKTRRHFVAIALNIWGDREVTWIDGRAMSEKELARTLKVQYTPTLLFLDERGGIVARLNGFYPPHPFEAALDYVSGKMEARVPFAEHMKSVWPEAASPRLAEAPFFLKPPHDLRRGRGARPVLVLFETPYCAACDELHREAFVRPEIRRLLARFDVTRFALGDRSDLITPGGVKSTGEAFARSLGVAYAPTFVFFEGPREVFRIEAYLRPFHLESALDYVASGAYRSQSSFQRYIQGRAEKIRAAGGRVDLW